MYSTELDAAQTERLVLLAEECAEVIQAVSKVLRHGYHSTYPETAVTNREQLEREAGDMLAVLELLAEARDVNSGNIEGYQRDKLLAVEESKRVEEIVRTKAAARARNPPVVMPKSDAGHFGGTGEKVIDDFFAWFGHDQDCMGNAAWDELARRIDLAIMKAVEENR